MCFVTGLTPSLRPFVIQQDSKSFAAAVQAARLAQESLTMAAIYRAIGHQHASSVSSPSLKDSPRPFRRWKRSCNPWRSWRYIPPVVAASSQQHRHRYLSAVHAATLDMEPGNAICSETHAAGKNTRRPPWPVITTRNVDVWKCTASPRNATSVRRRAPACRNQQLNRACSNQSIGGIWWSCQGRTHLRIKMFLRLRQILAQGQHPPTRTEIQLWAYIIIDQRNHWKYQSWVTSGHHCL